MIGAKLYYLFGRKICIVYTVLCNILHPWLELRDLNMQIES